MPPNHTVMFLCPLLDLGGAERHWLNLIPALADRGLAVSVTGIKGGGRLFEELAERGIPTRALGASGLGSVRIVPGLVRHWDARTGVIVSWAPNAHAVAAIVGRATRTAHVINWHRQPGFPLTARQRAAIRLAAKAGAGAIAVTGGQVPDLIDLGLQRSSIRVVPNGTKLPSGAEKTTLDQRVALDLPVHAFIVAMVARLWPEKRHEDFIEAVARLAEGGIDVLGVIVGDGPREAELRQYASARSAPVRFAGFAPDPARYMLAADVICLTSEFEALPISLIEAASCQRPIVATDVGGTGEIVVDGETGFVVPRRDVAGMQGALGKLAHDPSLALEMGRKGFDRWKRIFSFEAMVESYYSLLTHVTGPPASW